MIYPLTTDTPERKGLIELFISTKKMQAGVSRNIIAPVARAVQQDKGDIQKIGVEVGNEDFVLQHISKTRRGTTVYEATVNRKEIESSLQWCCKAGVWKQKAEISQTIRQDTIILREQL